MELLSQEYNEKIARIGVFLMSRNERVATAESCTGGLISSVFTQHSGASAWFLGSIIAYDDSVKQNVLGVASEILQKYGAVSSQTVEKMLAGAYNLFKADWSIAVSGIAGPSGATPEKPLGTVFIGISRKDKVLEILQNRFSGNRGNVQSQSVEKAADMILKYLI
jgi:nicotinamide-nucleotide amidase